VNALELRYEICKALRAIGRFTAIKSVKLINATLTEPDWAIEVLTEDRADTERVRRYRVTVEEITD
jgi:hypothetical protein